MTGKIIINSSDGQMGGMGIPFQESRCDRNSISALSMGCVHSRAGDDEERKINQRIEKSLRTAKKEKEFTIKLLLLGAGESGKSTFAKQMKILFLEGYNQKELMFHKDIIHSNIIQGMRSIITEARKRGVEFEQANEVRFCHFSPCTFLPLICAISGRFGITHGRRLGQMPAHRLRSERSSQSGVGRSHRQKIIPQA